MNVEEYSDSFSWTLSDLKIRLSFGEYTLFQFLSK